MQLADAKRKPREQLNMLADRLFPGDGVIPIQPLVNALIARGYEGWWTVELFNLDYAAAPAEVIAARAAASAGALFQEHTAGASA